MTALPPPHPGLFIRDGLLPSLGVSVTDGAEQLGISRTNFSRFLNGHVGVSPEMALRLEAWLRPESSAKEWLQMQLEYDLWLQRQKPAPEVQAAGAVAHS